MTLRAFLLPVALLPVFTLALLSALSGCSFVERNTLGLLTGEDEEVVFSSPDEAAATTTDASTITPAAKDLSVSSPASSLSTPPSENGVEILWEIPASPVDSFVLRYGHQKDTLTKEALVHSNELERHNDAQFGYVYRYVLTDVDPSKKVFISLAAIRGDQESAPSELFVVEPKAE